MRKNAKCLARKIEMAGNRVGLFLDCIAQTSYRSLLEPVRIAASFAIPKASLLSQQSALQINNGHTDFHFRRVLSMQNCYLTFVVLCTESLSRQSSDNSYSHFPIRGRYAGTCFERRIEYVRGEGECATETPCSASFKSLISDRLYLCKISLNFGLHTSYLMSSRQKRFLEPTLNPPSMENALSASSLCLSRSVEQFLDESSPTGFQ